MIAFKDKILKYCAICSFKVLSNTLCVASYILSISSCLQILSFSAAFKRSWSSFGKTKARNKPIWEKGGHPVMPRLLCFPSSYQGECGLLFPPQSRGEFPLSSGSYSIFSSLLTHLCWASSTVLWAKKITSWTKKGFIYLINF